MAPADEKKPAPPSAAKPAGPPGPPPPKNPGFVTATIDGREVVAKPGTTVIEAAKSIGIEIPYYCYHKRLTIAANCRMCLVEMSNSPGGKLQPACQVPLAEGVGVKTDSLRVKEQQRANLEFLLLNHPVDCPICDQSGECKLQDYYMRFDHEPSRLEVPKVAKRKRVILGPTVVLDEERCILCTRCVRFMREVAKNPQLAVANRGNASFIATFPGQPLDDKYSGNVVDICPVGALTSSDFRFRGRVWFMSAARSVCTGCARGCNTFLDYLDVTAFRYRPRENDAVNQEWMCDDGRLTYKTVNDRRILLPREGGKAPSELGSIEAALRRAAELLAPYRDEGTLGVLLSPLASLEDLLVAGTVAKDVLHVNEVFEGGRKDGWQDGFLKRADENPNRKGLEIVARSLGLDVRPVADLVHRVKEKTLKAVWAVGAEIPDEEMAEDLSKAEVLVVQAHGSSPLADKASLVLPASTVAEVDGTFVNFEGRAQRFEMAFPPRGESRPHFVLAALLGTALGPARLAFEGARDVFCELGPRLRGALGEFEWDSMPSVGQRPGIIPLAAGTVDGRLPGYRERSPAMVSEDDRPTVPVLEEGEGT